jgi:hypothetical protein
MNHRDELEKLGNFLVSDEPLPGEFDMGCWIRSKHGCQTAGCAIGWLPVIVPETGLKMERSWNNDVVPTYEEHVSMEAVSLYFEMDMDDAFSLFSPASYEEYNPSRQEVGQRILEYVNGR